MTEHGIAPCPFCDADEAGNWVAPIEEDGFWIVACRYCGASGPPASTPNKARLRWNCRGDEDWTDDVRDDDPEDAP